MADLEVKEEKPLSLIEVKNIINDIKKRDKELNFRTNKISEYLDVFASKQDLKKTQELKQKIKNLDIPRLKDKHIAKIIDIAPKDLETLKVLFVGEDINLQQEDLERILATLK